jgi:hypothetical protein
MRVTPILWAISTLVMGSVAAPASDSDIARGSLKGIKSIEVLIENLPHPAPDVGLSQSALRADVESQLRLAGLQVVEETAEEDGYVTLYVNLSAVFRAPYVGYNLVLALQQSATVDRRSSIWIPNVTTWSLGLMGMVEPQSLPEDVRTELQELVEKFINAYLSVNPRGERVWLAPHAKPNA